MAGSVLPNCFLFLVKFVCVCFFFHETAAAAVEEFILLFAPIYHIWYDVHSWLNI